MNDIFLGIIIGAIPFIMIGIKIEQADSANKSQDKKVATKKPTVKKITTKKKPATKKVPVKRKYTKDEVNKMIEANNKKILKLSKFL